MKLIRDTFSSFLSSGTVPRVEPQKVKGVLTKELQKRLETGFSRQDVRNEGHFQVLDFFSGAGGMTSGFAMLGNVVPGSMKLLGAVDINEDATHSYARNYGAHAVVRDVRELAVAGELENFLIEVEYDETKPLIVIGCSPCQGFTSHRKKSWDQRDPRNDLVSVFVSAAISLKPECIVMENVPEMYSIKYESYYQNARRLLEEAGYIVHQKIYNTAAFGVPQERFRLLSIAMKKDFLLPHELLSKERFVTVHEAIGDLPKVVAGERLISDAYHISARHKPDTIKVIKSVPKDGGNRPKGIGPKCLDKVKGFSDVYGRLAWMKPSITITQYARNPASGRFVHPEQDRGLTIREAARLQSFPDDFLFYGRFDSVFKQIGEAVPPNFSCAVAASVFFELISNPPGSEEKSIQQHYTLEPVSNSYASMVSSVKSLKL
ncbi:MAG: DNA cytosine methyltransferase [Pyrinomonadaceae bacterium]